MAAKSDFAQKLLHDLRLRKERMGVSQGSSRNHTMDRDAYRNPGNLQTGSRQSKSLKYIGGSKSTNHSRGSDRILNIKETSQQIVSYAGKHHRRSESVGDLSMAVTYAGGNMTKMDFLNSNSMIDFLNQISRRSLDAGNSRNGTMTTVVKHRPALTTIQIKEISKGVQNLYQIIRSTSNGTNVNRYSMEIGKELLKGAKGLEESLRMLVNLQEASEMMANPQRKSRITLLEDDDDDDELSKIVEQKQVALPRFSFDKPTKRSNLLVIDDGNRFSGHRRSASGITESVVEKPASIRSEKGRISNVIAKLMGLEEVPLKVDMFWGEAEVKKDDNSKNNMVKKPSKPVKDVVVPLNGQKPQQFNGLNINGESRMNQSNKNKRSDQVNEKQDRQSNGESKEKMHLKRTAANLQVEKKKTVRMQKSNENKLVDRNNQIQEPERRTQKIKQESPQIKQVKNTNLISKDSKLQPIKVKDSTLKAQEHGKTQQKMVPVARKKVDSMAVCKTESPRAKDEVLRRRKQTINTLSTTAKHKLSVLKETNRNEVCIPLKPEEIITKRPTLDAIETESTTRSNDIVPVCEKEFKNDPQTTPEINQIEMYQHKRVEIDTFMIKETGIAGKSNDSENKPKKSFYSSIQVVLTEQEKQLKEILIKDQLFLSTAEALFKLNIPVGFLHADDHNHHNNEIKLKLDCGYEILKRKARRQELSVHPYIRPSVGGMSIRFLDDLVKQLWKDFEDLQSYGRDTRDAYDESDYLHHMLGKDIHNKSSDINSFWDFGWHITTFTFVEKDEFVKYVEQDMLCRLLDEIVNDLLSM
ncbi:hypothetical protein R6Q57_022940 [Mikania cordata]